MKTVLAFGCFDILHFGHLRYLQKAKALGSRLIVVVARDKTAKLIKGRRPFFDEKARLAMISSLRPVSKALLGHEGGAKYAIISEIRPDIIALGYDQREDDARLRQWLDANGLEKTKIVRIRHAENAEVYKSSKALARLKKCVMKEL